MKALVYELNIPKYLLLRTLGSYWKKLHTSRFSCLCLREIPEPELPGPEWLRIRNLKCGICGSDLNALLGKESFSLEPYSSFPAVFGHEILGIVEKRGKEVKNFKEGDRVVIEPTLSCLPRGMFPPCRFCREGKNNLCLNFTKGDLPPGVLIGFNRLTGGGFGEKTAVHQSQLYKVPPGISDKAAVLTDPLASALHPVLSTDLKGVEFIAVVGCGIIGLLTVYCLRKTGYAGEIAGLFRHDFQGSKAGTMGANHLFQISGLKPALEWIAGLSDAEIRFPSIGYPVMDGGVDVVFDCAGSRQSLEFSLRSLRSQGTLMLVGTSSVISKLDLSALWFHELTIKGSNMYGQENRQGETYRTYQKALEFIEQDSEMLQSLVTHEFTIDQYAEAINTSFEKSVSKSIKVSFSYQ